MMRQLSVFLLLLAPVVFAASPIQRKLLPYSPGPGSVGQAKLKVGQLDLTRCGLAYCGDLPRPFDPTGEVPGTINIHFEYYPPTDTTQPPVGAIVANEGGPGYPSTGSRAYYLQLFNPLLDRRSLLLVDNRGTGQSAAIDCPALQRQSSYTQTAIQACGNQLGATSDLFGSGLAADDLAAVIDALNLGIVDMYGDSYGTFFTQTFAGRHPGKLRSVILDAAYAVTGADPWYPEAPPAARNAFNLACSRSQTCQSQAGTSMDRINGLLNAIRTTPLSGVAPNGDGTPTRVTANPQGLAYTMFSNASGPVVYRELDAAARAWAAGDTAPFFRLIAENQYSVHPTFEAEDPAAFSGGQFTAVSCTDYPQIYDMTAPLGPRAIQGQMAVNQKKATDPNVFSPFSIDEFLLMPLDYSVVNLCLRWPVPSAGLPPGQPVPPGTVFPSVPTLVLSGEFDSLTPAAQGAQAAALFPNSRQILVANSFHVTAMGDPYQCAANIVRRFVQNLDPGDTSCAAQVPEIHTVPSFAQFASDLAPATAAAGNEASTLELKVAAAAAYTAADAIARFWVNYDGSGVALRGGNFAYQIIGTTAQFRLSGMKWTTDTTVSGTLAWNLSTGAVTAALTVSGPASGNINLQYNTWTPSAPAALSGTLGGHALVASMYTP